MLGSFCLLVQDGNNGPEPSSKASFLLPLLSVMASVLNTLLHHERKQIIISCVVLRLIGQVLFNYPSMYSSNHPSMYSPIHLSIHPLSIHPSVRPSTYSTIYPSVHPSIHPSTHPPTNSSIHLRIS